MRRDHSEHLGDLLSAYLDGETHHDEAARVARHLSSCGACQVEYRDLAAVRSAVRGLPLLELPADVTSSVSAPIEPHPIRRLALVGVAAVAAAVVGVAAVTPPQPTALTPQDLSAPFAARASAEVGLAAMKLPRGSMTP